MPRNARKPHTVCRRCKTRFSGAYCPYCGAENGVVHAVHGRGGVLGGLARFLLSLVALALLLALAFIALDYAASAAGDGQGAARAILNSARNAIPKGVLRAYADVKTLFLDRWVAAVTEFFTVLLS